MKKIFIVESEEEGLTAGHYYSASEVDAMLSDVRALVDAAQNISDTCDFMGRSHITTDKLEFLKKAIAAVDARMK